MEDIVAQLDTLSLRNRNFNKCIKYDEWRDDINKGYVNFDRLIYTVRSYVRMSFVTPAALFQWHEFLSYDNFFVSFQGIHVT